MERIYINNQWEFIEEYTPEFAVGDYAPEAVKEVRIPHTTKELPFHYFDEREYQMLCGYRDRKSVV